MKLRHYTLYLALALLTVGTILIPFLSHRTVRPAGDDKVYVTQAVEMAESGHWIFQTLYNEPNYFKGPAHLGLIRIGMVLFGNSNILATLYMNLLLLLLAVVSIAALVRRNGGDKFEVYSTPVAFATCMGVYTFMFASQMEAELACLFAIGANLLDAGRKSDSHGRRAELLFWLVAGFSGWFKSPLHSALLGVSGILYWALTGVIFEKLLSIRSWLYVVLGVGFGAAGYLPAYFWDYENFLHQYIYRETLFKAPHGGGWSEAVVPFFTYLVAPYTVLVFGIPFAFLLRKTQSMSDVFSMRLLKLGLSIIVPSVGFFIWHQYRVSHYNLPVTVGLVFILVAASRLRIPTFFYALTALLVFSVWVLFIAVVLRFQPFPQWWSIGSAILSIVLIAVSWMGWFLASRIQGSKQIAVAAVSSAILFFGFGLQMVQMGERELFDLKKYLSQPENSNSESPQIGYYTIGGGNWSEHGYMRFWISRPIVSLHTRERIRDFVKSGTVILVPGEKSLNDLKAFLMSSGLPLPVKEVPWQRWLTHGRDSNGKPLWWAAFEKRDLGLIEKTYMILEF